MEESAEHSDSARRRESLPKLPAEDIAWPRWTLLTRYVAAAGFLCPCRGKREALERLGDGHGEEEPASARAGVLGVRSPRSPARRWLVGEGRGAAAVA